MANVIVINQASESQPGVMQTYNYSEQYPELSAIETMGRDELLLMLNESISALFRLLQNPGVLEFRIQKPFAKKSESVAEAVADLSEHFYLHAQNMIDYYEKFDLPRSQSMRNTLG